MVIIYVVGFQKPKKQNSMQFNSLGTNSTIGMLMFDRSGENKHAKTED